MRNVTYPIDWKYIVILIRVWVKCVTWYYKLYNKKGPWGTIDYKKQRKRRSSRFGTWHCTLSIWYTMLPTAVYSFNNFYSLQCESFLFFLHWSHKVWPGCSIFIWSPLLLHSLWSIKIFLVYNPIYINYVTVTVRLLHIRTITCTRFVIFMHLFTTSIVYGRHLEDAILSCHALFMKCHRCP